MAVAGGATPAWRVVGGEQGAVLLGFPEVAFYTAVARPQGSLGGFHATLPWVFMCGPR